jgi:beta-aspartyl-peptidase (threonine type)
VIPMPETGGHRKWSIAIHGGAGAIARKALSIDQEAVYRAALGQVVEVGAAILAAGGQALDAVEVVVSAMEDNPLFNAGRGAVFTAEGRNELDASIMDGKSLMAGSVAGLTRIRHPVSLARAVMERSGHVMLIGEGAERFARTQGLEEVEPSFFFTEHRWRSLEKYLTNKGWPIPPKPVDLKTNDHPYLVHDEGKHGTVGAVALDVQGHLAAATSTGGTTAKRFGRVGDTPIIGAGCYAADGACAVSCSGEGEFFIRLSVARTIAARMEMKVTNLKNAVDALVQHALPALGGEGGVVAVAPDGQVAWSYNTEGMYRACACSDGPTVIGLYASDP